MLRIQMTDNIFNFLPYFYLLSATALIIKPVTFFFLNLYSVNQIKNLNQLIIHSVAAITISSLLIGILFFIVHDILHAFRGFSRSVLFIDWTITLLFIIPIRIYWFIRCQRYGCEDTDITLRNNWRNWLNTSLCYFLPLITILAGYMAINKFYAGSFMPVSGQIKRWWGTLPNTVYGEPITTLQGVFKGILDPGIETGPLWMITKPIYTISLWLSNTFQLVKGPDSIAHPYMLALIWIILLAILIAIFLGSWQIFTRKAEHLGLAALAAGCYFHAISYKATGYLHAKYWYWISEMILIVIFSGLVIGSALNYLHGGQTGRKLIKTVSSVAVFLLVIGFGYSILSDFPIRGATIQQYDYMGEKNFIESQSNPGDVIGMTGGGLVGYFVFDRKIVNLDGLINSAAYYEKLKSDQADEYLRDIGVKYIYGEESVLLDSDPYRWIFSDHIRFKAQGPYFALYDYCQENCKSENNISDISK